MKESTKGFLIPITPSLPHRHLSEKQKNLLLFENAMAGARQAGLGVRFSTAHNKSWHRISEGLFSQVRIKQCNISCFFAAFFTPIPVQLCYCNHSAQSFSSLGQVWPALSLSPVLMWSNPQCLQGPHPQCWLCWALLTSTFDRGDADPAELPLASLSSAADL